MTEGKLLKFERTIPLTLDKKTGEREYLKDDVTKELVTFRDLAESALIAGYPGEENLAGDEKAKRFKLFNKIEGPKGASFESLTLDEKSKIKTLCDKRYLTLVAGRLGDIMDAQE